MGYTVRSPSKVIEITKNKDVILKMLDDVLHSCGLKIEAAQAAIADLVPGQPANLGGLLNQLVGKAEDLGVGKKGATGRLLPPVSVELTDVGNRLLKEYTNDWIMIVKSVGFTSADMEAHHINASRILVMELFIRIVMQILRVDSKLPKDSDLNREVWMKVLKEFSRAFFIRKI